MGGAWSSFGVLVALVLSACAPAAPVALEGASGPARGSAPAPSRFAVGRDTFAFPNLVRSATPDRPVPFANYCILMARAASQFYRFARFAPDEPPASDAEYARRIREILAIGAWQPPRPGAERVVIPAYPDLHTFSRAHETRLKAAFGSNVRSMVHWRTWRVGVSLSPAHQEGVARELLGELRAGRPAPLMLTNYPDPDLLNHAVLLYDYRSRGRVVEFLAYDPNDPGSPLALHFDPDTRGFWVEPLPYSPAGRVRAFRLYTSPLL